MTSFSRFFAAALMSLEIPCEGMLSAKCFCSKRGRYRKIEL